MTKENINEKYAKYHYFLSYAFTNDINLGNYRNFFSDIDFYEVFECSMRRDEEKGLYSKEIHDRIGYIINYLSEHYDVDFIESFNNIKAIYDRVKDKDNYEIYNNEMLLKYDTVDSRLKDSAIVWDKNKINESFYFDFIAFMSFDLVNMRQIIESNYVFNEKYLLFIKKFIKIYPNVLLEPKYKTFIMSILKYNQRVDNIHRSNTLVHEFAHKNYNKDFGCEKNMEYYNMFIELNNQLIIKTMSMNKKKANDLDNLFTLKALEKVYFQSILEKAIILNSKEDIDYTNINILFCLYDLIDYYIAHNFISKKMKHNILNVMFEFKGKCNLNIEEYNNYLIMLNSIELNEEEYEFNYIGKKVSDKEYNKFKRNAYSYIVEEFMETLDLDNKFIESLLSSNFEEDYLKHFIYNDDFYGTINRYLIEYPSLFSNKEIHDRAEQILRAILDEYKKKALSSKETYKQNVKTLKKLNKLYYGKR